MGIGNTKKVFGVARPIYFNETLRKLCLTMSRRLSWRISSMTGIYLAPILFKGLCKLYPKQGILPIAGIYLCGMLLIWRGLRLKLNLHHLNYLHTSGLNFYTRSVMTQTFGLSLKLF
ncbi:hypothetical protein HAX54_030454 [Datura stramonium]|uniref:Uncharacterized protein n=1 Tax=Datura stramonium TaxID=4076 RepID=A0ABS8V8Y8_DATST|nr:hypothetical protein [Datura stramonium]